MSATLLLNSNGLPLSFLPLSTLGWKESITYLYLNKASVLEWHDAWIVKSVGWETPVPAVMMLSHYEKIKNTVKFNKPNVFLRDGYVCQYCGVRVNSRSATLDHVLPVSLGGKSNFENCVCACSRCNGIKGNNPKVVPHRKPVKPSYYQLIQMRKQQPMEIAHPSWIDYLGLDATVSQRHLRN
jgi:5-methylcytosine-specific restriction endonuclease McrA